MGGTKSCWFGRNRLDWARDDTCRSKLDGAPNVVRSEQFVGDIRFDHIDVLSP